MTERTDATACCACTRCSSQCGKTVMWTIGLPLLGAIACGLWGCGGEEPANLNATTTGVTVTITAPKGSGDGAKPVGSAPTTQAMLDSWDGTKARFDFQGVTSASTQPYSLTFAGTIAPGGYTPQWELDGPAGTLTNANTLTPGHNPPASPGEGFVRLKATKGDPPVWVGDYDRRKVIIYRDHLDRDYANFGVGISCGDRRHTAHPYEWSFSRFGVTIPMPHGWNCFGSMQHAYDGSGSGAMDPLSFPSWIAAWSSHEYLAPDLDWSDLEGRLARGDVVAFYSGSDPDWVAQHAHVCRGSSSDMWGANNEPVILLPKGHPATWRWYQTTSRTYFENVNASWLGPTFLTRAAVYKKP